MNEEPDLADFINKKRVALPPLPTKTEQHSRLFEADLLGAWEKVCVKPLPLRVMQTPSHTPMKL